MYRNLEPYKKIIHNNSEVYSTSHEYKFTCKSIEQKYKNQVLRFDSYYSSDIYYNFYFGYRIFNNVGMDNQPLKYGTNIFEHMGVFLEL